MEANTQIKAEARYIRVSPQKARLVVDMIRGQQAGAARTTLRTVNKRIAPTVLKVLESAIANATNRFEDLDVDRLYVSEAYVHEGPRMKRVRPAPMGRAYRIQRRLSHIVIKVTEKEAWDRKFIRMDSGWASTSPGAPAGSPNRAMPSCCRKTWS